MGGQQACTAGLRAAAALETNAPDQTPLRCNPPPWELPCSRPGPRNPTGPLTPGPSGQPPSWPPLPLSAPPALPCSLSLPPAPHTRDES